MDLEVVFEAGAKNEQHKSVPQTDTPNSSGPPLASALELGPTGFLAAKGV